MSKLSMCPADLSTWMKGRGVFVGRLHPGSGYHWNFMAQGIGKQLNACHVTFALAYLAAKVFIFLIQGTVFHVAFVVALCKILPGS